MDKKGTIITYLPFKKYLILVGIVILIYLLYNFFILKSLGVISLPANCPSNIIPDGLWLSCKGSSYDCGMPMV